MEENGKKVNEEKKENLSSEENVQVKNLELENKDPNEKKMDEEKKENLSSKVNNLTLKNKDNNIEEKTSEDENAETISLSEEKSSIKSSIEKIISLCKNDSTQYTKILFDLFCDLQYKFFYINSLKILPIIPFPNLLENKPEEY